MNETKNGSWGENPQLLFLLIVCYVLITLQKAAL